MIRSSSPRRRVLAAVASSLLAALLATACKAHPGDSCDGPATKCYSPTQNLSCQGGHYMLETCKGPKKCSVENGKAVCDNTHADIGDPCVAINSLVCSSDGKSELRCVNHKYALVNHCGGGGCSMSDTGDAYCSWPYGIAGEPCKDKGACSQDAKTELACVGGKLVAKNPCRGDEKCVGLSSGPNCDRSVGLPGDSCDPNDPELAAACTQAGDTLLVCQNHKLVPGPRCAGEGKCGVAKYGIDGRRHFRAVCDQSMADEGDDCIKDQGLACATDLKSRLICKNGKFTLDKLCKKKDCIVHSVPDPFECD